jgi:hypothetical protein
MKPAPSVLSRFLVAAVLLLGLAAPVAAAPQAKSPPAVSASGPVLAEWFEWMKVGGATSRRSVVRIAAMCMALGLFIMYRNKH